MVGSTNTQPVLATALQEALLSTSGKQKCILEVVHSRGYKHS